MVFPKIELLLTLLLLSSYAHSVQNTLDFNQPINRSVNHSTIHKKSPYSHSHFQFLIPSFVVHGIEPDPTVAAAMPRKMDGTGDSVITPGFGLEYKSERGLLLMGAMLKDCFNNLAGTVQIGATSKIDKDSDWGLSIGVYARQTPLVCDTAQPGAKGCYTVDGLNFKFVTYINGESVDIIPLPFFHYSYNLYHSRELQINLKLMANFLLNEVGFAIPL